MIEAKKVTFDELFNGSETSQVRVPDYQRGFSWEHKQVQEFFDDLIGFAEKSGLHHREANTFSDQ